MCSRREWNCWMNVFECDFRYIHLLNIHTRTAIQMSQGRHRSRDRSASKSRSKSKSRSRSGSLSSTSSYVERFLWRLSLKKNFFLFSGRAARAKDWSGDTGYRVHVSPLNPRTSRRDIEKIFSKYGSINEVHSSFVSLALASSRKKISRFGWLPTHRVLPLWISNIAMMPKKLFKAWMASKEHQRKKTFGVFQACGFFFS